MHSSVKIIPGPDTAGSEKFLQSRDGIGGLQLTLFDETHRAPLFDPVFIVDYPAEVSPLARRNTLILQ